MNSDDLTFDTAPLEGLCPQPLHLMTEEQMREWVVKIQQLRTSHQTYKATMERRNEPKTLSEFSVDPESKKKKVLDEFSL